VALAAALGAARCEIYTDVNGVYTADPREVPGSRLWKRIPHDLMVELATRGAGVLHPRSVELAKQFGVPLMVLNSLNENEGTEVMPMKDLAHAMEEFRVTGVTSDQNKLLVTIELMRPSVLNTLWHIAGDAHLQIVAPQFSAGKVQFFIDKDSEGEWRKLLDKYAVDGFFKSAEFDRAFVPVSVVGDRFSQDGAALCAIVETLASEGVTVTVGSASALAVTVAVPKTHADDAVRALHVRFIEQNKRQENA
jgi:aspartate kinase